ncbi:glutathione S-transferase 1-1-like [Leptopilina heterotoma]|uniref:glutathione S-transferase 1-1-like n=1 Tax=Leptopilina heterotoma TaxID=63436 RepID=UPI001CA91C97|nr:glutathione S-transferase 1-1-like [Leptopilina heterotoma]
MTIDFYFFPISPPCRTVMMLAKALGIHFNYIKVCPMKGEHMKPEFLKLNPQHTIPTINDNGLIFCESRAIIGYLVNRYAKNDALYPKDPQKKGIIDQRLYFDVGTLYDLFYKCYLLVAFGAQTEAAEEDVQALKRAFETLNIFLQDNDYVAGTDLTIADFSIITSVSSIVECGFDIGAYENVNDWYERCGKILEKYGFEDINLNGARLIAELYKSHCEE